MYKYVAMFSWFGPEDNYFGTYTTDDFVCKATTSEIDSEIWVYTPTPTYSNTLVGTITYKEINMNITKIQEEDSSFYVNIDATIVGEDGNTYKVITDKNNKYKTPTIMPARNMLLVGSPLPNTNVNYYALKYIVDNEPFATDSLAYGDTIILREEPQKEDFEFSGWSEAPETMPAYDVEVYGNFIFTSVTDVKVDPEQSQKVVEDNQLFIILPNGRKYNVIGMEL